jgi:hypothetical protein
MKIVETPVYPKGTKKQNVDAKEIAKWMKEISKIKSFGLVELPKYKSHALARYIDIHTLKDGYLVAVYAVQPGGLYRDWVPVNTKSFKNTGRCTTLSCISEASLMKSIMRYKDGKRVESDGAQAIQEFLNRYNKMVERGVSGRDYLRKVFENEFGIKLREGYTLDDIQVAALEIVSQRPSNYNDDEEEIMPNYWNPYRGKKYKTN